ncbi:unnamed protein product [Acanthoscelides obtectus]|uniref:PiggyBac transposable element-derived protein domain-containing protein n=2 Tax=Acanthoscelides obtectus TaxID=200917 RepID=A0A9P0PY06_ACAOB|nr:unnamed protein product [Acanthoscelides obtectus]CAK1680511.1 PiggyBac transposable element-derived protein 4 [Acanthoscelides obtectus]
MTSKTKWTFQELQKATQEELLQIVADCEAISDAQAINSDLEGESDADDNLPLTKQFIPKSKPTTRAKSGIIVSRSVSANTSTTSGNVYQDDSDDSVKDPDYEYSGSDSGSEMTNACNSGMNECQGALDISTKDVENDEDEPEETGADGDDIEFIWTKIGSQPKTYKDFNYNQPQGVKDIVGLTNGTIDSPVQYFHAIFSDVVYDMIITESNRYAEQKGVGLNFQRDELQAFFGMLLIMGFHTLPSLRLYWSTDQNFHVSRISNVMSQKRFLHILRYLHLNDNEVMPQRGQENFDKLYKIRPLVDILNERFSTLYAPYRELSIDESMVGFKGRTTLKQYMPMKPVKRGFKVWVIACSRTGYNLGFKIYEGKEQTDSAGISLGERTVLTMSDKYNGEGRCLYFDNFFNSFPLLKMLLAKNTFACGTLRKNKKFFPKSKMRNDKSLKRGESDYCMAGDISVYKWKDRGTKPVLLASNFHDPREETTVLRTNAQGNREEVICPSAVSDYNKYMLGVDKFDQLMSPYNVSWKSRRWWMKLLTLFLMPQL